MPKIYFSYIYLQRRAVSPLSLLVSDNEILQARILLNIFIFRMTFHGIISVKIFVIRNKMIANIRLVNRPSVFIINIDVLPETPLL